MKTVIILFISIIFSFGSHAQFKKATLQASGLTCAMCTKAISTSLQELPFVQSVKADIKNSAFNIVFKEAAKVDIDELKKAVEDAGFSVAKLKLTATFDHVVVKNDEHVLVNGNTFHFLNIKDQTLNGDKEIMLIDKHFVSSKEFKKYSARTGKECIQTGKAAQCCIKDGIAANSRIYHVTI